MSTEVRVIYDAIDDVIRNISPHARSVSVKGDDRVGYELVINFGSVEEGEYRGDFTVTYGIDSPEELGEFYDSLRMAPTSPLVTVFGNSGELERATVEGEENWAEARSPEHRYRALKKEKEELSEEDEDYSERLVELESRISRLGERINPGDAERPENHFYTGDFEAPLTGEWAVNLRGLINGRLDKNTTPREAAHHASASTLAAVAYAEGDRAGVPDWDSRNYDFYQAIVNSLQREAPEESVEIQVREKAVQERERLESELSSYLQTVREVRDRSREDRKKMEGFERDIEVLESDIEEHLARVRAGEYEDLETVEERTDMIGEDIEEVERVLGREPVDYEEILDRTIPEVKEKVVVLEDEGVIDREDYEQLLQEEDRVTLKTWFEERLEERRDE